MKRRDFVAASLAAGMTPLAAAAAFGRQDDPAAEYYELRRYHALAGPGRQRLLDFLRDAALPAWNRINIRPVGVFTVLYGPTSPTVYVLLPHPNLDSIVGAPARLAEDAAFQEAGSAFLSTPLADPAFVRLESSLMRAFSHLPRLEVPAATTAGGRRLFELRIYESHSEIAARKKVQMFNEGGEIAIFRRTGLTPVFFGETLIGPQMPNLTYMLTFENMVERDKSWGVFGSDPEWRTLSADPYYADTVSNISSFILQPTPFSQI